MRGVKYWKDYQESYELFGEPQGVLLVKRPRV